MKQYKEVLRPISDLAFSLKNLSNSRFFEGKAHKFRFYPTEAQKAQLDIELDNARFVWNHALDRRSKAYQRRKESFNYVSLSKHITDLKKTARYHWLKRSSSTCLTQKLKGLDTAFNHFFNPKLSAKYPRFKKKHHQQSIRYQLDHRVDVFSNALDNPYLKLPKLGKLNIKWSQRVNGLPKMATVIKTACGHYYVTLTCEVTISPIQKSNVSVGIDMGIKDVIVTSDGEFSGAPKLTYRYQRKLRKLQRQLSKMKKGSHRYTKQRLKIARLHERIGNARKDFLHKLTTWLVRTYDIICMEDLNVKGMMKNKRLSKAIADIGFYEIKRQLEYKAAWYGKKVIVISRWFPSTKTCSSCGKKQLMPLSQRVMDCECGLKLDRDYNAAINTHNEGLRLIA